MPLTKSAIDIGGFWLPRMKPGTVTHALWLGIGIGAFLALIAFPGAA